MVSRGGREGTLTRQDGRCTAGDLTGYLLPDLRDGHSAEGHTDMNGDGLVDLDDLELFARGLAAGRPGPSAVQRRWVPTDGENEPS